jgi:hypothetical protein
MDHYLDKSDMITNYQLIMCDSYEVKNGEKIVIEEYSFFGIIQYTTVSICW